MRLGWGRDDGPFFFSCPGRKPHERCEPGPILLCMGLFSRFCVWAPRCTAEEALRCVRDTRSLVLRAHGESIQLQCIMLWKAIAGTGVMDSGLGASRRPGMTNDKLRSMASRSTAAASAGQKRDREVASLSPAARLRPGA